MKIHLLILNILLSLSMATTAWARLGENENAVIARYGKPALKMHHPWGDEERFSMNGFAITVTFIDGISRGESFHIAAAFLDIIKYYGGQPEPSIANAHAKDQLITFIEERISKAYHAAHVEFTLDDSTGKINLVMHDDSNNKRQLVANIKDMKPDDFKWTETGSDYDLYRLDLGMSDEATVNDGGPVLSHLYLDCATEQDAQDVAEAFKRLCELNGWTPPKY